MNRYWLETYGCQMNKAESNSLEMEMLESGWTAAESAEEADVVILNTCSVRATAENRIWGRIGKFKSIKKKHPHTLVMMGCMAERLKDDIGRLAPAVDLVVGTFQKNTLFRLLQQAGAEVASSKLDETGDYRFSRRHAKRDDYKALVPIMHGCNNFCSYCIVPYVRGRETSRNPENLFKEMDDLVNRGVREITLLGQNVNSYTFSEAGPTLDFPGLLHELFRRFPDAPWIRFLTSHPKDFSDELIDCMSAYRALCRHIHLPVQHGSDKILRAMNRKYTRDIYIALVEKIRRKLPDVRLGTDILIGFPGETEEDFRLTLDLLNRIRFDDAFTYYYNPREGTKAFEMEDSVPEKVKLERLGEIIELQRSITAEKKLRRVGSTERVLVEEISRKNECEVLARTEGDEMAVFPGDSSDLGTFRTVRLTGLRGGTFTAAAAE